jgi:hypothetical protein
MLRFLSNTHDPKAENAMAMHAYSYEAMAIHDLVRMVEEWESHLRWINAHVTGRPQATKHYTVEQLETMEMIGVYADEPFFTWLYNTIRFIPFHLKYR